MKYSAVACATLIAAVAAQPHYSGPGTSKHANKHAHNNHKHARNNVNVPRAVVTVNEVVTETVYVTEMIDETTTVWITPGQEAKPTPTSAGTPNAPGNFYETPSAAAPPPPPAPEAPKPSPSPSSQAAAPPATTTSTSVYVAPPPAAAPSTTSVNVPTPHVDVAPPPPVSNPQTSSAPSTGGGGPGSDTITGDFTWYDIGMGSCGEDDEDKALTECIVAVSHIRMGQQSNGNPMCGKTISMSANGKTITGTVKDKCMGCLANDIDVSKACYTQFFDLGVGRTKIEWWFN
ncbi:uncharacterized protein G6M90_00g076930 [Metarhizium brunneum]|uniref:Allergen Asp f 7 n=1 Tax=Metarhizium brunneum TaxID=500148 RepID=A0A7D5UZJ3_9HYPO